MSWRARRWSINRARGLAVLVLAVLSVGGLAPVRAEEKGETPLEVARRFLRAFESKDFPTLRTLFAPNAMVASALISSSGPHQLAYQ
jgi:hypothetical protein